MPTAPRAASGQALRQPSRPAACASTASRSALPGLKCGASFSGIVTCSPLRGLRPMRGGRQVDGPHEVAGRAQRREAHVTDGGVGGNGSATRLTASPGLGDTAVALGTRFIRAPQSGATMWANHKLAVVVGPG